ncbi:unnamed protein product [Clonostachys chloroleuca]|uniref:Rhodopsin domain-containing protein n=1 Tax=Clonostachys chloroleuca TaxID=1926264 RepID=A0AA35PXC0_9HYPO|nr:unnamed protein product [Clonostachys chloroleuca]
MVLSTVAFDISSACICGTLILTRCLYRLFFTCKVHPTCHRRWRVDDAYMAFAIIPLVARTATISTSFKLNPDQLTTPVTIEEAEMANMSVEDLTADRILSRQLLLPARIFYALFLWCLKLCLLSFYTRFVDPLEWGKKVITTLRWVICLTFIAVLISTLTECHPLQLAWKLASPADRPQCSRALVNLLVMAVFNIITDVALIILPFPMLRNVRLDRKSKIQLSFLFGIGFVVVVITILRIPLILINSVSQQSRSLWASIETLCACIVANTAFFYTLVKDLQGRHSHSKSSSNHVVGGNFYLQSLPSSSGYPDGSERPKTADEGSRRGLQPIV